MTVFPNVWGRGALFAYSGLEGTATYHDSLCGQLMDSIDFSCYMANEMRHMEKLARVLGFEEDAESYASLFAKMSERINAELYDEEAGRILRPAYGRPGFRLVVLPVCCPCSGTGVQ